MKKLASAILFLGLTVTLSPSLKAEEGAAPAEQPSAEAPEQGQLEFVSTGATDRQVGYDAPAVGDPYQGKSLNARALAGHPDTQKPYTEDCQEERCLRAKKRQLSQDSTWKNDQKKKQGSSIQ